jgi:hypothetical protein
MAAVTLGVQTASTANATSYVTGAFTPAASDLLIALAWLRGTTATGSYASSDAGKTYSEVTFAIPGGSQRLFAYGADQLADADSQTGTMDVTGDAATGCAQGILRVSGMTKVGAAAIRQFKVGSDAAGITPELVFDAACLTGNPIIFAVGVQENVTVAEPSGWTKRIDIGFATPDSRLIVSTLDSGFTGTTVTAGGTTGTAWYAVAIELDASGAASVTPRLALLGVGV